MKVKATIWLTNPKYLEEEASYTVATGHVSEEFGGAPDMTQHGWYLVEETTLGFKAPYAEDVIPAAVKALREKQRDNRVKVEEENQQIEKMISDLLSLTYEEAR